MHRFILLLALISSFSVTAQDVDRLFVDGKITAPVGDDVEGVNIYNISTQKGTVTDKEGKFKLLVGENDRVQVTALQFQSFTVIIDKGIVDSMQMTIYLNPSVNVLEEVIVRPYDLSGNINVDVKRIKTVNLDEDLSLSYEDVEFNSGFLDDSQTAIRGNYAESAYYNGQNFTGGNIIGLVGLLFKSNKTKISRKKQKLAVSTALRQRFSNAYLIETFNIPQGKENDFLYFVEDNGLSPTMLNAENEVLLLEYMFKSAEAYKSKK